jgi:hypothetical protein
VQAQGSSPLPHLSHILRRAPRRAEGGTDGDIGGTDLRQPNTSCCSTFRVFRALRSPGV